MAFSYLLSDELAELYLNYKDGKNVNQALLELFFSFYEPVPFISLDQLNKYGSDNVEARQALMASCYSAKSEEQVLEETKYRIKLTTDCNRYPCVDINKGKLKKEIVASYKAGEVRDETIKHLNNLCKNAQSIAIYDKYMFKSNDIQKSSIALFFKNILDDQNAINIFYIKPGKENIQKHLTYLKKIRQNCTLKNSPDNRYKNAHDRYILIDKRLEIILSSGLEYLFDISKEISLIYREII
ncbi:MAG: hypothetical protein J5787_09315 [Alphaproteobacteria bacterium]|nr:hypothetical protein [Alphaproteobacteria bacterium]